MNKFAPKLTFHIQCFIYAAHWHKGYSHSLLARTFGIHRQTVSYICGKNSGAYLPVKKEADRLGLEDMWRLYNVNDLEQRVKGAVSNKLDYNEQKAIESKTPRAEGSGMYWLPDSSGNRVSVNIRHLDEIPKAEIDESYTAGYYYKDPRGGWVTPMDEPFLNVAEALRYFTEFPPDW